MMWLIDIASKMIDALAMVIILCMVYGALLRSLPSARLIAPAYLATDHESRALRHRRTLS